MRFDGTVTIGAPRDAAWAYLTDPRQVESFVPGVDAVEVIDETHFKAITRSGVSFIKTSLTIRAEFSDLRAPVHATIRAQGRAPGLSIVATAQMDLSDGDAAGTTVMDWSADIDVSGRLAIVGARMVELTARSYIAMTLDTIKARLGQRALSASSDATTLPPTAADVVHFDPNWCLFWGKRIRSSQLDIWIPYIKRSRKRFAIMTASDDIRPVDREKITALPNAMIIEPYEQGLEWLRATPGFRGYLYIGTQPENFLTVNRQRRKAHVYIGHGESGKGTSGFRTGSLYDSIFFAEYSVVRRFPGAIRPWIWRGAIATGTAVVEGVRKDAWTHPRKVKTILYAPTWESGHLRGDYTSLDALTPVFIRLLPELAARGIEIIVRPHPATGVRLPELRDLLEELRAAGAVFGVGKTEAFERADVLISDISGVTAEFLLTEKPSIMPITPKLAERGRDAAWLRVEYPWVYRWDATGEGLTALLTTIETQDPLRKRRATEARKKFRHHRSLGDAVRTWEIALDTLRWRKWPIPLRIPFEMTLLASRLRRRSSSS